MNISGKGQGEDKFLATDKEMPEEISDMTFNVTTSASSYCEGSKRTDSTVEGTHTQEEMSLLYEEMYMLIDDTLHNTIRTLSNSSTLSNKITGINDAATTVGEMAVNNCIELLKVMYITQHCTYTIST